MDMNEFRSFILESGLDVWTWIDMSISVACADHENELKNRRDAIIQRLYASRCQSCDYKFPMGSKCNFKEGNEEGECLQKEEEEEEDVGFDENLQSANGNDEQKNILEIKILLDDQTQSEKCLIDQLQRLVDMNTTFNTLKETDIGRHVSRLRKHSSNEVRRLVKFLVRKWKETVDEWVRLNTPIDEATQLNDEKKSTNECNIADTQQNTSVSCYFTPPKEKVKHNQIESQKLAASSKKRQHDQNSQDAKKHRTSEIMEFHNNIPRMKNGVHVTNNGEITEFHNNIPKMKNGVHVTNNRGSVPLKYW